LSYPFSGDRQPNSLTFVREIPRIRRAFLDTPPAIMLALDYLLARDYVDTSRVEGAGVSLGAPFVSIAGALDKRFTRIWAIHGSGGSYRPLEQNMRQTISFAPLRYIAASIANVIIAGPRLDPVHWAPRIAPRPFIMVNADADERLPRSTIEALYRSAREPKELIWLPGGHVRADSATLNRLVEIVMQRMLHDTPASGPPLTDRSRARRRAGLDGSPDVSCLASRDPSRDPCHDPCRDPCRDPFPCPCHGRVRTQCSKHGPAGLVSVPRSRRADLLAPGREGGRDRFSSDL
jgi:hypothetical protein